jgi:prepilin-type N-terminal cleavage/methylation domain-containing protein
MTRECLRPRCARGFTLVELAIVIFIIGLLIAGLIGPVEVQLEARDRHRTQVALDAAGEALYGYALSNRRLPCPDQDGDGMEDPTFDPSNASTATCDGDGGFLPWADLAVGPGDAWGNRFTYRVTAPSYIRPAQDTVCNGDAGGTLEFDICATGDIEILTRGDDASSSANIEGKFEFAAISPGSVVAVVLSHGRNGYGATGTDGSLREAVPSSNADEDENADGDNGFVARRYSRTQSGCADDDDEGTPLCEFDDLVLPISRSILNSRMVSAGQLP